MGFSSTKLQLLGVPVPANYGPDSFPPFEFLEGGCGAWSGLRAPAPGPSCSGKIPPLDALALLLALRASLVH